MADDAPWRLLPPGLAGALRARLEATAASLAAAVAGTPAFASITDDRFRADVDSAVGVALDRFLDLIGTDQPALPPHVRDVFVSLGAAEARDDRGPEVLLAALRSAARALFRAAADALGEMRLADAETLIGLGDAINAYVDELAAASTDGFALQVREQAGEGDRLRRLFGELLLRGGASSSDVAAAGAAVGWPAVGVVVPVLLPLEHSRDARFRFGGAGVVVDREDDAVLLVRGGPRASRSALAEALRGRDAVVGPALDWSRVPDSLRLAERTAASVPRSPGAATFVDDHLATLAVLGEPGAVDLLRSRRLAPLDAVRPSQRDALVETLRAWLRHWGSRAEIAADLHVHPQTVSYRLRRLRDVLGDDLDDPGVRFDLALVLAVPPHPVL